MCGIAGIYRRDGGAASEHDAARMAAQMAHRGPDGHGALADGPVALGHVRLAIRDLSEAAHQPMVAPGGAGVLAYNGEVYNDGPLREDLRREVVAFRGSGDSEVVLHAAFVGAVGQGGRMCLERHGASAVVVDSPASTGRRGPSMIEILAYHVGIKRSAGIAVVSRPVPTEDRQRNRRGRQRKKQHEA